MADEDETKERQAQADAKAEESDKKSSSKRLLPWMTMAVIVVVFAGVGFVLGRFLGGPSATQAAGAAQQAQQVHAQLLGTDDSATENTWYYDLEPVVANLDDPGVTRYVRVTLTLQVSNEVPQKKGAALFTEKLPVLKNLLTIYLASQTVEDMRGDRNLRRIQSEILEAFNEKLYPDAKPQIKGILFKGFAIQ